MHIFAYGANEKTLKWELDTAIFLDIILYKDLKFLFQDPKPTSNKAQVHPQSLSAILVRETLAQEYFIIG